ADGRRALRAGSSAQPAPIRHPSDHSDIADRAAQRRGDVQASTFRHPQSMIRVPRKESQTIHPTQQLSGWALMAYEQIPRMVPFFLEKYKDQIAELEPADETF